MLKVVCVVDKVGTALDRLAKGVSKYHDNLNYVVLDVHPKRPSKEQIDSFVQEAMTADIIDWQYYRSAELLRNNYPWLSQKKQIITHNNPYSIEEQTWNDYDLVVGNNKYIYSRLGEITQTPVEYVPLTVDTDFWTFNTNWVSAGPADSWQHAAKDNARPTVIMVANRIEGKKGILPVAIACGDLGLKMVLVGAISDPIYFTDIMATGCVEFHEQVSDETLRDLYYKSDLHICNSVDNFESGTLPILEAMLCGVPVITRRIGHVPELNNGDNMVLYTGDNEDVEALTQIIHDTLADKKRLADMRDKAWNTAKARSFERRAYMYQKLYRQVLHEHEAPVSIVTPVYESPDTVRACINAVANQTYKNIELIICDDAINRSNESVVRGIADTVSFPVRYLNTASEGNDYGLARARNEATIEATGEIMVYCDQRMLMDQNAVEEFVKHLKPRHWVYGNKGTKKEFVENFSSINRQDIINGGLFNERINLYGGQSQELRARFRNQGVQTEYVESARATPKGKSSNRNRKRQEIIKMKNRLWKMGLE